MPAAGVSKRATHCLDRAMAIAPTHLCAWLVSGWLLAGAGKVEEAIATYQGALKIAGEGQELGIDIGAFEQGRNGVG